MSRSVRAASSPVRLCLLAVLSTQCAQPLPSDESETQDAPGASANVFAPVADATVDSSRPSVNLGTATTLLVDASPSTYETFLRFANLPTAAIDRAVLRLYVTDASSDGPALYLTGTGWGETTLTWSNRPARASGVIADRGAITAGTWVEYDVTAQVRGKSAVGFVLASGAADGADFSSRQGVQPPQLVLTPSASGMDAGMTSPGRDSGTSPALDSGSTPGTDSATSAPACGNQTCGAGESCSNCPADCNTCAAGSVSVWLPRPHAPRFTTAGGTFSAEIAGPSSLAATGFAAALRNELRSWPATVTRASYGTIHHGLTPGWTLQITAPAGIPPELFDLSIVHPAGGGNTVERSVQVLRDPEESFYILHISDQHVRDVAAASANGAGAAGGGSEEAMKWAAAVFNVVNPRFVLATGDNTTIYNTETSWPGIDVGTQRLRMYRDGLRSWRVPSVTTTGNHDVGWSSYPQSAEWRAVYEREIGERSFSVRMGSFYVLSNEWTFQDYFPWARDDFRASFSDASVKYRLIATHYPGDWVDPTDATHLPNLRLAGHTHATSVFATSPYPTLLVATAQNYYPAAFFSFQRTATGWQQPPQVATHGTGRNVFPLFGDRGAPKVTLAFDRANDGTQSSNTARIGNGLPFNFHDGRVKFLLPRGSYAVTGGTITASYDYANNTRTAVLVRVNIPASGNATVTVAPR